ncbi:MAG: hypothetical protein R3D26_17225 [Cyanobacteriota/Melainabacteria group bacterium]
MKSFPVVEDFYVIEDREPNFASRKFSGVIDLSLHNSEKRFGDSIVKTVTFPAHALPELVPPEHPPEFRTCVLTPSIRVNQWSHSRPSVDSGLKCLADQL